MAWLTGAVVFLSAEALAAVAVTPPYEYSYTRDYISQLCVPEWTRLAVVMNTGLCIQAVLFVVGAVLAVRASSAGRRRPFIVLAALYGLGVTIVGVVPIGPNAPAINVTVFHRLGALLAMTGGNAAVLAGSSVLAGLVGVRWYRGTSVLLGVLGLSSFVILSQPSAAPSVGLWERGSVYPILLWQLSTAALLLIRRRAIRGERDRTDSGRPQHCGNRTDE